MKLKITAIGNSAGVILPRELLARLRLEKGDELFVLETPDGIRLTTYGPTGSGIVLLMNGQLIRRKMDVRGSTKSPACQYPRWPLRDVRPQARNSTFPENQQAAGSPRRTMNPAIANRSRHRDSSCL